MHVDKSPKEKPCCTLPTVKKLLEEKRRRETSSVPPLSCSAASTSPAPPPAVAQLPSSEPFPCTGASSSYTDMAVSYEQWATAPESTLSYYQGHQGPSYAVAYSVPMASEYGPQQQVQAFEDVVSQTYDCPMTVADQNMASSWSHLAPSQATQMGFGSGLDAAKLEEARMLIGEMDYNRAGGQDEDGDTILHIYTAKGLRECAFAAAEKLRELGRLDVKEHKGKTALLVAVTANQPEIVKDLVSFGTDINSCDVNGQTALHLAAHYGFPEVLQTILSSLLSSYPENPVVNLEARNFEGMTPLHCAAISHSVTVKALSTTSGLADMSLQAKAREKLSCVQMLLTVGASPLSQEIKSNKTVLHLAVKEGNIDLVRYLLRIPLDNMKDFVNMKAHGNTALHMAAGLHGNPQQEEILRLVLSGGADPGTRNLENQLPAHLLQSGTQGEQLKLMLKRRNASSRRRVPSLQDQE